MKKKRIISISIIVILVLFLCSVLARYYDGARVSTGHEPKLVIKTYNEDIDAVTYWGLGYKVVRYIAVSPKEPYENNVGAKMGSWFMKYEKPDYNDVSVEIMGRKAVITDRRDIAVLSDCLIYQKYIHGLCEGIVDYEIDIDGDVYSVKSGCLGVSFHGKEAHITEEDMENILDILNKY